MLHWLKRMTLVEMLQTIFTAPVAIYFGIKDEIRRDQERRGRRKRIRKK
jgi:hypothetical protein